MFYDRTIYVNGMYMVWIWYVCGMYMCGMHMEWVWYADDMYTYDIGYCMYMMCKYIQNHVDVAMHVCISLIIYN